MRSRTIALAHSGWLLILVFIGDCATGFAALLLMFVPSNNLKVRQRTEIGKRLLAQDYRLLLVTSVSTVYGGTVDSGST